MKDKKIMKQLEKLAASYTPEWKFDPENPDAGSALAMLIADMFADSKERLSKALHKHKIQYLNRFDKLVCEPVSVAKGYVQFTPVAGNEDVMAVPAGTQLMAEQGDQEILFETVHDICLADAGLTCVIVTDRQEDSVAVLAESLDGERLETVQIQAFSTEGKNESSHKVILGLPAMFDGDTGIDLSLYVSAENAEKKEEALKLLSSGAVQYSIARAAGEEGDQIKEIPIDRVTRQEDHIRLEKENYEIGKALYHGKEGYYLILTAKEGLPQITVNGISFDVSAQNVRPDHIRVEGVDVSAERVALFGKPLALMNACEIDSRQVLSKKGAVVTMNFSLDYEIYEDSLENSEVAVEYKAIMKKQPEQAASKPASVVADRISWEYRSVTGWKKLFTGSEYEQMMNGGKNGEMSLTFVCPMDMAEAEEDESRIRIRLLHAENIYKMPAVYQCPVINNLQFSYTYQEKAALPVSAESINNSISRNLLSRLESGLETDLFSSDLEANRSMYFIFDNSISGLPFSLYFDMENLQARPLDFTVEYGTADGFKPIRIMDGTDGLLHSGVIRFLIGSDMAQKTMFGREGYVLRMTGYEKQYPAYRLPVIKGIYPNMAKVENRSSLTEYFYVDDPMEELTVKLGAENLTQLSVSVLEKTGEESQWVEWKRASRSYEPGRVYQENLAEGTIQFSAFAFSDIRLDEEEAPVRVTYRTYTGDAANVEKGTILTVMDSNRYVSEISNPFAAFGGCDAYTEKSTQGYIEGILKSRNRIVTEDDLLHLLRQTSYSVLETSCIPDRNEVGEPQPGIMTVAVLTADTDNSGNVFYEIRKEMQKKLEETGNFCVMGREIHLVQPRFLPCSVSVWLEKDNMENAYELTRRAEELITDFLNPYHGGSEGKGWKIGSYPRVSQIRAWLKKNLPDVTVARIAVTASVDGEEKTIREDIHDLSQSPFVMPVSGEHRVYIDLKES